MKMLHILVVSLLLAAIPPFAAGGQREMVLDVQPEKAEYSLGEPVYLRARVENRSNAVVNIMLFSGPSADRGSWPVTPLGTTGRLVRRRMWRAPRPWSSGFVKRLKLKPGDTFDRRVFAGDWLIAREPGDYRVAVSFLNRGTKLCTGIAEFRVRPSTSLEIQRILDDILPPDAAPEEPSEQAAAELAAVGHDLAVDYLLKCLAFVRESRTTHPFVKTVTRGLRDIASPASVQALVQLASHDNVHIRSYAARALGSLPEFGLQFETALRKALQDERDREVLGHMTAALAAWEQCRRERPAIAADAGETKPVKVASPERQEQLAEATERIRRLFNDLRIDDAHRACRDVARVLASGNPQSAPPPQSLRRFLGLYVDVLEHIARKEIIPLATHAQMAATAQAVRKEIATVDGLTKIIVALENPRSPADFGPPEAGYSYLARLREMMRRAGRSAQAERIARALRDDEVVMDALNAALVDGIDRALDSLAAHIEWQVDREFVSRMLGESRQDDRAGAPHPPTDQKLVEFISELTEVQEQFKGQRDAARCGLIRAWCWVAMGDGKSLTSALHALVTDAFGPMDEKEAAHSILDLADRCVRAGMFPAARRLCREAEHHVQGEAIREQLVFKQAQAFLMEEKHDLKTRGTRSFRIAAMRLFDGLLQRKLACGDRFRIYREAIGLYSCFEMDEKMLLAYELALSDEACPDPGRFLVGKGHALRRMGKRREARAIFTAVAAGDYPESHRTCARYCLEKYFAPWSARQR